MQLLGCIADDFTGATDIGAALVKAGYRTAVTIGHATVESADSVDAVVVALKTRTTPVDDAVDASTAAYDALVAAGADRFYFKYCSTFDSTETGNIGPVTDALLDRTGASTAIMVPSFPANGRTVYQGHLFVGDALLSDSSMRNHPLTPMTDANLERVLAPQTSRPVRRIGLATVRGEQDALTAAITETPGLVILDAIDDSDLARIAAATPAEVLLTGGAGLAAQLTPKEPREAAGALTPTPGRRLVVSGSASEATRGQVSAASDRMPSLHLDLDALGERFDAEIDRILDWAEDHWAAQPDAPVLVYATGSAADLEATATTREEASELIEAALARIASRGVDAGVRQLIVAGGETSGSVVSALGITELLIGPEIAPGVVWANATVDAGPTISIALKSGNFGSEDMFSTAWEHLA
ncbi:uncharacterized protein YgbK (DUF1537 family) [Homoserinimonas aerilata]|uniref:3-oxo-tetronate kinase n=1 Tax=Homoserinimonas aerilata TaxID=1162970 RepID=A0A542YFV2_9MICO|nr:3-oxo-tetronate kinase [Homoserinimonas aerilata]TQL46965.1 uncharacterized protein YgbK (DUF1537 family) [Homoserinimonas aerilata]